VRLDDRAHKMFHVILGVSCFVSQSKECVIDSRKGGVPVLLLIRFGSFVKTFVCLDLFL
jgi:hypothetical protein